MQRLRRIAAAPRRSASETWTVITQLVSDTLNRAPDIDARDVRQALAAATPVGRALVAGGHLETRPLILRTESLELSLMTVSGTRALSLDENLSPVPGAATAKGWVLHLPQCDPLSLEIQKAASASEHLSANEPLDEVLTSPAGPPPDSDSAPRVYSEP
jgi:hypothetical protein